MLYRREPTGPGGGTGVTGLTVTGLNRAASELWGVPEHRALGRPLLEVVRRHTLETLAERGGELELEVSGKTLRCQARPEGKSGALILEDISEHRRREAELREATAVLSHEFRTPVTAIRGILEALEYDMPDELQQSFVAQGLQETERLARLVEDLAVGFRPTRARTLTLSEAFERVER
ncbi:MAG: histidine kinase dimerization/phospho-acceptor domain-containing protein, partial [Deinococcus sp.]|nr:histidine kinase dimerization/phospho-acceptor domain-containing protein [Deinococcus sp.]